MMRGISQSLWHDDMAMRTRGILCSIYSKYKRTIQRTLFSEENESERKNESTRMRTEKSPFSLTVIYCRRIVHLGMKLLVGYRIISILFGSALFFSIFQCWCCCCCSWCRCFDYWLTQKPKIMAWKSGPLIFGFYLSLCLYLSKFGIKMKELNLYDTHAISIKLNSLRLHTREGKKIGPRKTFSLSLWRLENDCIATITS